MAKAISHHIQKPQTAGAEDHDLEPRRSISSSDDDELGQAVVSFDDVVFVYEVGQTFYSIHHLQNLYYPFVNLDDWQVANLLLTSQLNMQEINQYLFLNMCLDQEDAIVVLVCQGAMCPLLPFLLHHGQLRADSSHLLNQPLKWHSEVDCKSNESEDLSAGGKIQIDLLEVTSQGSGDYSEHPLSFTLSPVWPGLDATLLSCTKDSRNPTIPYDTVLTPLMPVQLPLHSLDGSLLG
ncbi:hypothetical protein EV363DRAFT_1297757 [Boletus edulis]|nr:hypothetical protein EV363DRAFT_1297757 [Boletus edulis]